MVKMTLDFSSSYRAITNADLGHTLVRQISSWDGQDIPIHQVTMTSSAGDYVIPATTFGTNTAYDLSHSASADQFDFYSQEGTPDHPFLRFAISVNGPPLCENYVQATYANTGTGWTQYAMDKNTFELALLAWINYMVANPFQASAATLSDDGGLLGEFSSSTSTLIDDFEDPTEFFSCIIYGSIFDDSIASGSLSSTLYGGLGDDTLRGQEGDDGVFGGDGNDYLLGIVGIDLMFGGNGDDRMHGGDGSDIIKGGNDTDVIYGDVGDDRLSGQAGTDTLWGGAGNDSLEGGADNDRLIGDTGKDTLDGGGGNDVFSAGEGADVLYGDDGDDFLRGGLGRDTLTGGVGMDTFNFNYLGAANADRIVDFVAGSDRIALSSGTFPGVHANLNAQEFRLGTAAVDGDDRILYDSATGRLYYDPDGTLNWASSAAPVLFAIVANHAALTYQDFYVL